jgi:hypothetical protein
MKNILIFIILICCINTINFTFNLNGKEVRCYGDRVSYNTLVVGDI